MTLKKKNIRLCDGKVYSIELVIDEDTNRFDCYFFEEENCNGNAFSISETDSFLHINEVYDPVTHMKYFIKKANERICLADRCKKEVSDWDGTYEDKI